MRIVRSLPAGPHNSQVDFTRSPYTPSGCGPGARVQRSPRGVTFLSPSTLRGHLMFGSRGLLLFGLSTLCASAFALGDGKLHIYFVDIGQGDATLIIGPQGTSCLVDGGPSNTPTPIVEAMNDAIAAGLTDNTLDYVVCSHFHTDHMHALETFAQQFPGGIIAAYDRGGARSITAFTEYDNYFGASGLNKRKLGETFSLGTNCTMKYVGKANAGDTDENNNGVIYVLEFGAFRCSLGGDLGYEYETSFAPSIGNVDHYKANHHGSRNSSLQASLDVLLPQTHTFSYAVGNSYGHPHTEAVDRLNAIGSARYDTINHVAAGPYVELVTDGGTTYQVNGTSYNLPGGSTTPPAAPSALTATAANSSEIGLTWTDNATNEDSFVVSRSTTAGGPYTDIATLAANVTSYSNTGLSASTTYYYVVRATNTAGSSAHSNEASATTQSDGSSATVVINEALPAPGSGSEWVELYNAGTATVDLTGWQIDDLLGAGSAPVSLSGSIAPGAFYVHSYSTSVLNNTGDDINLINPSGTVVDTTTYGSAPSDSSWARSTDGTGTFAWDATPSKGASNAAPAAPGALAANAVSSSEISLTWSDNSSNEDNFVVARSTTAGGPYTDVATLGANVTSYSDTGLSAGTAYYYVVRATNASGASPNSSEASATTQAPEAVLRINEALPAPSSGSEWVELYNAGTTTVDLTGWQLDDLAGGGSAPVSLSGSVAPGAFYVYSYSTSVLNNTGDDINLINPSGTTVDTTTYGSASYDQSWARSTDGTGSFAWDSTPSQGASNSAPSSTVVTFNSIAADDGWVLESGETSNTGGSTNASNTTILIGDDKSRKQYKGLLSFNTSAIPDTATITGVTLKVTRNSMSSKPYSTLGTLTVDIRSPYFGGSASTATDDFAAAAGAADVGSVPQPASNGSTVSSPLSSTAYGHIDKAGKTQLRLRFTTDDDNDNTADNLSIYSGDYTTDTTLQPQLEVEYTN